MLVLTVVITSSPVDLLQNETLRSASNYTGSIRDVLFLSESWEIAAIERLAFSNSPWLPSQSGPPFATIASRI
jgi:hypothetical protein